MPRDVSSCVRAVIRLRPLLPSELARGEEECCEVRDASSMLIRSAEAGKWRQYTFDACLPADRTQKQAFQESGVTNLLDSAIEGYAGTVLAYGQTGSGKTHTILGRLGQAGDGGDRSEDMKREDGLVMRSAKRLFRRICGEGAPTDTRYTVSASFTEIYNAPGAVNECICDLLNPEAGKLEVRCSQKHGFFVSDLQEIECHSATEVRAVLEAGVQNRKVGATHLNRDSSRSHALFTLRIDSEQLTGTEGGGAAGSGAALRRYGKITFVDLAGSERLKESLAEGLRAKETQAINKSLFTLGKVISQLAQGKHERHVPYRDSKLTQLLQESFGGAALCLMVTCLNPCSTYIEESLNSLNYAQKAMNIRNRPVVRLDEHQQLLHNLKSENAALRRELEVYRTRFGMLSPSAHFPANDLSAPSPPRGFTRASPPAVSEEVADSPHFEARPRRANSSRPGSASRSEALDTPGSSPVRPHLGRGRSAPPASPPAPLPSTAPAPSSAPPLPSSRSPVVPGVSSARGAADSYAMAAARRRQQAEQHHPPRRRQPQQSTAGRQLPPLPPIGAVAASSAGQGGSPTDAARAQSCCVAASLEKERQRSASRCTDAAAPGATAVTPENGRRPSVTGRKPPRDLVRATGDDSRREGSAEAPLGTDHGVAGAQAGVPSLKAKPARRCGSGSSVGEEEATERYARISYQTSEEQAPRLTSAQVAHLDGTQWSDWQIEFARPGQAEGPRMPHCERSGRSASSCSGSSSSGSSGGGGLRPDPPRQLTSCGSGGGLDRRSQSSSRGATPPRPAAVAAAAGRIEGLGASREGSRSPGALQMCGLAELNAKLSSMQQATSALVIGPAIGR